MSVRSKIDDLLAITFASAARISAAKLREGLGSVLNFVDTALLGIGARPDRICTGEGTVASPFVHPDGTGGIQTMVNSFTKGGGRILLIAAVFQITTPVIITNPAIVIEGTAPAFFTDPNGEAKPQVGCLLDCTCTAIRVGIGGAANRLGGNRFKNIGFWGPSFAPHAADNDKIPAIEVVGCIDQAEFDNLYIGNFEEGIAVTNRNGGGNWDSPTFNRVDVVACRRGIVNRTQLLCVFERVTNCVLSDNEEYGLDLYGTVSDNSAGGQPQEAIISGNLFVRCGRGGNSGGVRLRGQGYLVYGNIFRDCGWNFITGGKVAADGLINEADDVSVFGNRFRGTKYGAAIRNRGKRAQIFNNAYGGNYGDIANGRPEAFSTVGNFSTNQYDIYNEVSTLDTVIQEPGFCNVTDFGKRTIWNGESLSEGDPDDQATTNLSPWKYITNKPHALRIFDTINKKIWRYSSAYQGGRIVSSEGVGAGSQPGSTGLRANELNKNYYTVVSDFASGSPYINRPAAWVNAGPNAVFENGQCIGIENNTTPITIRVTMTEAGYIDLFSRTAAGLGTAQVAARGTVLTFAENGSTSADGFPTMIGSMALPIGDTDIFFSSITAAAVLLEKFRLRGQ
jgi:hypothetical protein